MTAPSPGRPKQAVSKIFILLALCLVMQCFLWKGRQKLERINDMHTSSGSTRNIMARSDIPVVGNYSSTSGAVQLAEAEGDEPEGGMFGLNYWDWYQSSGPGRKPFVFAVLVMWAAFLFATIGITASDFFCPNLATVADRLGMGESTAGVTFLAFGNGSPDVFSTFSALKSNTFSLAIGELLGASCFIVSVVVGCMALVQPFQVPRWPFIRDVGFFTFSVVLLIACLTDGHLTLFESGGLMILYVIYVSLVVGGNWWIARRGDRAAQNKEDVGMNEGGISLPTDTQDEEEDLETQARKDSLTLLMPPAELENRRESLSPIDAQRPAIARLRSRASSVASSVSMQSDTVQTPSVTQASTNRNVQRALKASPRLRPQDRPVADAPRPTFSLLGAIEFRDAINSLRRDGNGGGIVNELQEGDQLGIESSDAYRNADMSDYFGPVTPFPSGHYHSFAHGHGPQKSRYTSPSGSRLGPRTKSVSGIPRSHYHETSVGGNGPEEAGGTTKLSSPLATPGREYSPGRPKSIHDLRRASSRGPTFKGLSKLSMPEAAVEEQDASTRPISTPLEGAVRQKVHRSMPSINLIPADESANATLVEGNEENLPLLSPFEDGTAYERTRKRDRLRIAIRETAHVLFPALQGFAHKSLTGKILAIFASPAIFALTLTLPVVDDEAEGCSVNKRGVVLGDDDSNLDNVDLERDGISHQFHNAEEEDGKQVAGRAGADLHHLIMGDGVPSPASERDFHEHHHHYHGREMEPYASGEQGEGGEIDDASSDDHVLLFNKYLTAAQCAFGALFCSTVFFSDYDWSKYAIPGVTAGGCCVGILVLIRAEDGQNQYWRLIRCFAGFLAAMTWIAAIADAVVDILQVFGRILGLSNAIIGLTIFAIGNSCADLIANLTVASFAPSMSYAACFGGPMLNILLGIGGAGTYVILSTGRSYVVHFSSTLWVSAIGLVMLLVATMIFIPYNGYWITRKWAIFLLGSYCSITILNIIVETRRLRT